ncbi:MAG: hypothetical protein ACM3XM_20130 [Mycobacterium leprae]
MRIPIGLFLVLHGLVHTALASAADPDGRAFGWLVDPRWAWLLTRLGLSADLIRLTGTMLWVLVTLAFVMAGLGVFGFMVPTRWWRGFAVVASCGSLLLLILFWHPWFITGAGLDLAVLIGLLGIDFPRRSLGW